MAKKWSDRYGGYRIRDIDGVHFYMAYLMPKRTEAEVYINEKIDVTDSEKNAKTLKKSGSGYWKRVIPNN